MSIVQKLKSVFKPKPAPYKTYSPSQLRVLAMRARMCLEQHYKKSLQIIQASDSILMQCRNSPSDCYRILQEIGKHVVEVQCIKIYCEMLRKIEDRSAAIVKTNGDIALMKTELNWFQCVLWYRKCRKIQFLDQLNSFCYNFFKGVDVTCELHPKCQIFKLFPITLYLQPNCVIPLKKILPQIMIYIGTKLDFSCMEEVFKINRDDIKKWVYRDRVEYQDRYLSRSKSPLKKSKTPKKQVQKGSQPEICKLKKEDSSNSNTNSPPMHAGSSSMMRKIMQSSKLKQPKKKLCAECGIQIEPAQKIEEDNKQGGELGSFGILCELCVQRNRDNQERNREEREREKENIHGPVCQVCGKQVGGIRNDISFNTHGNTNGNNNKNSFSFSEDICQECLNNTQRNNQPGQDPDNMQILEQPNSSPPEAEKKHDEQQPPAQPLPQQIEPANPAPNPFQHEGEAYDDEAESLQFIRESIVQKKKPLKKPYMVSIYARGEYTNQSFKK